VRRRDPGGGAADVPGLSRADAGGAYERGEDGADSAVLPGAEEVTVLLVGLASGVAALALSRGTVFEPLRARLTGWRAELASCPLCLGFHLTALLTALEGTGGPLEWLAAWAVSTGYAAVVERLAE
jgi:hypothetical protein